MTHDARSASELMVVVGVRDEQGKRLSFGTTCDQWLYAACWLRVLLAVVQCSLKKDTTRSMPIGQAESPLEGQAGLGSGRPQTSVTFPQAADSSRDATSGLANGPYKSSDLIQKLVAESYILETAYPGPQCRSGML